MANSAIVGILRALLVADTAEFDKALERSRDNAKVWAKELAKVGDQAKAVGEALTKNLTLPLIAIGAGAAKLAIDFESAFAGVRKTVDGTDAELAAMSDQFRALAKTIPVNVTELARLGEAAGALNIPKEQVVDFSRVMAELGVTTNLTSDQAAESIAKIQTIFQSTGKETENFASTLVDLGHKGASTESQILEMANRLASAGRAIGLSQAQVLGFSSALANVGIEAEAGGTAMSKVFASISKSVSLGTDDLAKFAKFAGQSAGDFAKAFKTDAAGAITSFIEGIGNAVKAGRDINVVLDELGISEQREAKALRDLALSGDNLSEALKNAGIAWRENTALSETARKRFETTEAQLTILWNRIKDVGITIGNALLPAIKSMIGLFDNVLPLVEGLANWFGKLPAPIQTAAIAVAGLAAAIGPLLYLFGTFLTSASAVVAAFKTGGIAATGLGTAFTALTGPIGLTILGLTALAAIVVVVATHQTESEKAVKQNTAAFKAQTAELNSALTTYNDLNGKQHLTTDQTKELERVTRLLAEASGLTVDAFKKEAAAGVDVTASVRNQIGARKDLLDAYRAQLIAEQQARLTALSRAQQELAAMQAPGPKGELGPGGEMREIAPKEQLDRIFALQKQVGELQRELAQASDALNTFDGIQSHNVDTLKNAGKATAALTTTTGQGTAGTNEATAATRNLVAEYAALAAKVAALDAPIKAQIEAGQKIGLTNKEIATITHQTIEVIDLYLKQSHEVTQATQAQGAANEAITKTIMDLTTAQRDAITVLVRRGVNEGAIAKALKVTEQQVREVAAVEKDRIKTIKDLDKEWDKFNEDQRKQADDSAKAVVDNVRKVLDAQRDAAAKTEDLGATELDKELARIARWAAEQKAKFTGSAELARQYYAAIDQMAEADAQAAKRRADEAAARLLADQTIEDLRRRHEQEERALGNLIGMLLQVGNAGDRAFEQIAAAIGDVIAEMKQMQDSGANVANGFAQWAGGDKAAGFANIAAGALGATDAIMNFQKVAGASTSRAKNALSGAKQGAKIGTMILPGWGTAIGAGIGAIVGALNDGHNAVRKQLGAWADTYGGFDELHKKMAAELGADSEKLWAQLTQAKDPKQNLAAMDAIKKGFEDFAKTEQDAADRHDKMSSALGRLGDKLQAFGGAVPAALRPTIDALLQMQGIPDDIRAGLTAVSGDPSWQTMQARAQDLGIDLRDLGPKFSEARISDIALGYVRDLTMFSEAGANMTGVLSGMSDELSGMYNEAKATGTALPESIKPYMEQLVAMGKLVDDNGQKVENLNDVAFKEIEDKSLKDVVDVLKEIKDLLAKGLPAAAQEGADHIQNTFGKGFTVPYTFEATNAPTIPQPEIGLEGGTHGQYVDWGSGTPVTLHGREAVVPYGDSLNGGSTYITVVSQLDGREVARNQVRYIPGELSRAGI